VELKAPGGYGPLSRCLQKSRFDANMIIAILSLGPNGQACPSKSKIGISGITPGGGALPDCVCEFVELVN